MKLPKNLGTILLAIWLIVQGLMAFIPALASLNIVWAILAIAAGVLLLLDK